MSGKRDSNSRPQPWQGCALPTELFPHHKNVSAKLEFLFELSKFNSNSSILIRRLLLQNFHIGDIRKICFVLLYSATIQPFLR